MIAMSKLATARRTHGFTESVIRVMTRLCHTHDGLNLSQGFPNCPAPDAVKRAACEAVGDDINQYAVTWGTRRVQKCASAIKCCYAVFEC